MTLNHLTVAITGMNVRPDNPGPGIAVARCLRDAGFSGRIVGLGYDALDPGLYSHDVCDSAYLLPYPSGGDDALLERLRAIRAHTPIDILIPCLDAELPGMVRLDRQLAAMGITTFLPTAEQLRMRGKEHLHEIAALGNMSCPETKSITGSGFFQTCEDDGWEFPLVVKGLYCDARVVHNTVEGVEAFSTIASHWGVPVLVQRFVRGDEINLTAVGDGNGNLLGAVMMKKMAVTDKGKAWAGVTIEDSTLLRASEHIVRALKWRGPLEVEVMRDARGELQLIEINPRFPAWVYLTACVGRNLPWALVQLTRTSTPTAFAAPKPGMLFVRRAQEIVVPLAEFESVVTCGELTPAPRAETGT